MKREFSELSSRVIGCAIEVHRVLGLGLLESVYRRCLARELELHGIAYEEEAPVPFEYKGLRFKWGYKVDLFVEKQIVLELKTVERLIPVHKSQTVTYMRLLKVHQGLLMNFDVARLANGGLVSLIL